MFYLYDPEDGLEGFATEEEALQAARSKIEKYKDHRQQKWIDGVDQITVFKLVCGVRDVSPSLMYSEYRLDRDCEVSSE